MLAVSKKRVVVVLQFSELLVQIQVDGIDVSLPDRFLCRWNSAHSWTLDRILVLAELPKSGPDDGYVVGDVRWHAFQFRQGMVIKADFRVLRVECEGRRSGLLLRNGCSNSIRSFRSNILSLMCEEHGRWMRS